MPELESPGLRQPSIEPIPFLPCLSTPRPNGSPALERTVQEVQAWLEGEGITVHHHRFTLRPYLMELLGLWMTLTGILLLLAALARWGWIGLALAVVAPLVPLLEVRALRPTVSALVRQPAHNLVATFPAPHPEWEVILPAHLDSKTELLDHIQRRLLLRMALPAAGLILVCGVLMALEPLLPPGTPSTVVHWLAVATSLPVTAYGLAMAANLIGGRFSRRPSTGAVDNGAAEAVTGERPLRAPAVSSDAFAFLRQGIPATTLGSFDRELGGSGFHSALDHPDRIDTARLAETVELLTRFLTDVDARGVPQTTQAANGGA
jgi:hypothetical protein